MKRMMNREQAWQLVQKYVKNPNSQKHMLAVESIMRSLARKFGQNEDIWGITGLLHDVDMEITDYKQNPAEHTAKTVEILKDYDLPEEVLKAIPTHNQATGKKPETLMEKCLYASDPITGLIVAATLVLPDKKINNLKVKSVLKRMKEKSFAAGADREAIKSCTEFDISLEEFATISVQAMQEITDDLEL